MSRRWLPGLFVLGAIVLVAFETTLTLLLGVVLLLATIAVGWHLIADPGFLESDAVEREQQPTETGSEGDPSAGRWPID